MLVSAPWQSCLTENFQDWSWRGNPIGQISPRKAIYYCQDFPGYGYLDDMQPETSPQLQIHKTWHQFKDLLFTGVSPIIFVIYHLNFCQEEEFYPINNSGIHLLLYHLHQISQLLVVSRFMLMILPSDSMYSVCPSYPLWVPIPSSSGYIKTYPQTPIRRIFQTIPDQVHSSRTHRLQRGIFVPC